MSRSGGCGRAAAQGSPGAGAEVPGPRGRAGHRGSHCRPGAAGAARSWPASARAARSMGLRGAAVPDSCQTRAGPVPGDGPVPGAAPDRPAGAGRDCPGSTCRARGAGLDLPSPAASSLEGNGVAETGASSGRAACAAADSAGCGGNRGSRGPPGCPGGLLHQGPWDRVPARSGWCQPGPACCDPCPLPTVGAAARPWLHRAGGNPEAPTLSVP